MLCFHRWVPKGAEPGVFVVMGGSGTTVLYQCEKCGAHKTEALNGHWTLEQLSGSHVSGRTP